MTRKQASGSPAIYRVGTDRAVRFAAGELERYMEQILGRSVKIQSMSRYDGRKPGLWIGVAEHFGAAVPQSALEAEDDLDDAVLVNVQSNSGIITGSNPRSVLFAVYRYLEALGCRWFRPGTDGEFVIELKRLPTKTVLINERPSARHRCICIEGGCSVKHCRDMIDYAARRGFNAYFLQFRNAYTFFNRWYGVENPGGRRRFTSKDADKAWDRVKAEAHRRGMALHTVGHGWTCEPFGIAGAEWSPTKQKVPSKARKYLAKIGGRRELWGGVPLNTNLCYSNPEARKKVAAAVAEYGAKHPDEDLVHVWLADGSNNQCECNACKTTRPSDFYVRILNDIDARMTAKGLRTRIVFLAYVDLLWSPQKERIANPDRFVLMFAPITRSYTDPFLGPEEGSGSVPPFRRNKLKFPKDPGQNLRFLAGWGRAFRGECVDFDYHLMFDPTADPSGMNIVPILHQDLRDLEKLGMDGFISCQRTRVAFPTGIALHVMGHTLWNHRVDYQRLVKEYFGDLFGADGRQVLGYLKKLGRLSCSPVLRDEQTAEEYKALPKWGSIPKAITDIAPAIKKGRRATSKRVQYRTAAWAILEEHSLFMLTYIRFCASLFRKDEHTMEAYEEVARLSGDQARAVHHVFDGDYSLKMMRWMLKRHGYRAEL